MASAHADIEGQAERASGQEDDGPGQKHQSPSFCSQLSDSHTVPSASSSSRQPVGLRFAQTVGHARETGTMAMTSKLATTAHSPPSRTPPLPGRRIEPARAPPPPVRSAASREFPAAVSARGTWPPYERVIHSPPLTPTTETRQAPSAKKPG